MTRKPHVYFVSWQEINPLEPRAGWYVAVDDSFMDYGPFGPYPTKLEAQEMVPEREFA